MISIAELEVQISGCEKCSLHKERNNTVPGNGNSNAEIMFLSEGPGFHEDRTGIPYMGNAGVLLESLLMSIDLTRGDIFVANIIKCRTDSTNRDPSAVEILACKPWIDQQIEAINPKLIVTLGRYATAKFITGKISDVRGSSFSSGGRWIYPVFHPAYALRNPNAMYILKKDFLQIPIILKNIDNFTPQISQARLL